METVYRPPHARKVVHKLLRQGAVERDPARRYLTDATLIRLAESKPTGEASPPATLF